MTLIQIDTSGTRLAAQRLAEARKAIAESAHTVGANFVAKAQEGLAAMYGPELGAADGTYWTVTWVSGGDSGEGGTLGLLTVQSSHPYVMGYEFGVGEHPIWARNAPGRPGGPLGDPNGKTALYFWWEAQQFQFLGTHVNRAHAKSHHFLPYLDAYLREVGQYGWSSAVRAALAGDPYPGVIPITPPKMYVEETNDDKQGR